MSETLLERLNRIDAEIDELKSAKQSNNKQQLPDIKSEIEKHVDEKFVTNLYRNK
jgi:hypothetical protein